MVADPREEGRPEMGEQTCDYCTRDVDSSEVLQCSACGRDGLCPDCVDADMHRCEGTR